ncbi:hypothetical protein VD0002_g2599 [Verticillium dahliae]|uniref:DNA endonuclease activator Ctp1 C-terminal domain-containing protein n=2 Tax=Verticillium dahliae TaxID=27337 RepID=G2WRL9_VERDV|nr:uncharacterized protein VDAG_00202 [Verticillium dahliae VdLs.17]KAF3344413.1 NADH dehydrogenase [ubiquinone] 1 beta subcomplex subunit 7 [Verticillium dahliae VDG2]KAH6709971.1 DNA repair protein endonuclease SAE2/CtIP C-terminus-domain-containing protein [Verticillium dahliae]EGY13520.1 hypothetical protein VDAG_00202 [Verticillium dahliae VdLs.17]PNH34205.1 hypothetical protein BJF96_g2656 [Verticillium dahliae]PNH54602.1 hypothetical protein VD0003_g2926 [Verticillium dahliae]
MASWFEKGRPAILEALTAACNQIDTDLRAELNEQERRRKNGLDEELELLKRRSATVDSLEAENRRLRADLLRYQTESTPASSVPRGVAPRPTTASSSPNPRSESPMATLDTPSKLPIEASESRKSLLVKSHQLQKKFDALDSNYRRLMSAYNKKKDELSRREGHITQLEAKIEALQHQVHRAAMAAHDDDGDDGALAFEPSRATRASSHVPPSAPPIDATASVSFSSEPGVDAGTRELCVTREIPPLSRSTTSAKASPAEDEFPNFAPICAEVELPPLPRPADPVKTLKIKVEPSSDGPILVMERAVAKRKSAATTEEPPSRRVKTEFSRSSSIADSGQNLVLHQDSLDLDEVGRKLSTPRKNRFIADAPEAATGHAAGSRTLSNAVLIRPDDGDLRATRTVLPSSALTPINPNARTMRPLTTKSAGKVPTKGLSQGIGSLAEDGNLYQRAVRKQANRDSVQPPRGGSRLNRLLNTPGSGEKPTVVRSAPRPLRSGADTTLAHLGAPGRRELPFGRQSAGRSSKEGRNRAAATNLQRQVEQGEDKRQEDQVRGSLRLKQAADLRLEDFKVNPRFNNGQDYAFSEVIRGKDDRACLPGCTDMSCCGKQFRGLALAQRGNSNVAEDTKLFEKFLGDGISRIWGMSKEEKEELWVEAKTWELAEQMGKHRHRYARRASPPGFWNTEFPSTQEVEAEKAEAEKRQRQMAVDRYREAMRPGGRWVFRDE